MQLLNINYLKPNVDIARSRSVSNVSSAICLFRLALHYGLSHQNWTSAQLAQTTRSALTCWLVLLCSR